MIGKKIAISDQKWEVIPDIWDTMVRVTPKDTMLVDPIHDGNVVLSYEEVSQLVKKGAAALQSLGLGIGDCVSIFSENSHRWFIAEQSIMKAGGCNAVRGAAAPIEELQYIYNNSRSVGAVVQDMALLKQLYDSDDFKSNVTNTPRFMVVLYPPKDMSGAEIQQACAVPSETVVLTYEELLAMTSIDLYSPVPRDTDSPATLVYTSGTTSRPKGVVLSHRNLLHQVTANSFSPTRKGDKDPVVGDVFLSILPCWHIFERTAEYFCLSRGCKLVYSNLRSFRSDLVAWKPHVLITVPRLLENIQKNTMATVKDMPPARRKLFNLFSSLTRQYIQARNTWRNMLIRDKKPSALARLAALVKCAVLWPLFKLGDLLVWKKIRARLGGRLKAVLSGGSALPMPIEAFFDMIGINVIVGYGLSETSPVIACRVCERNVLGTVGKPMKDTVVRIVHPENRTEVAEGEVGVLLAKGPSVMTEYAQDPEATNRAIDSDGFFDTGDLARINRATGDIIITGRAKDTIVLSNGENVEPQPIEDDITAYSPLIDQTMLVGQDERYLGALAVLNAQELVRLGMLDEATGRKVSEVLGPLPVSQGLAGDAEALRDIERTLNSNSALRETVLSQIGKVCERRRPWERVASVRLLLEPFTVQNGMMTQTLKVKRQVVSAVYRDVIEKLFAKNKKAA